MLKHLSLNENLVSILEIVIIRLLNQRILLFNSYSNSKTFAKLLNDTPATIIGCAASLNTGVLEDNINETADGCCNTL